MSHLFRFAASAALCTALCDAALAQDAQGAATVQNDDNGVFIRADKLINDAQTHQTIAEGNVEVHFGDRRLRADRVIYDIDDKFVRAQGSVQIVDPDGTVRYAEEIQVDEDLENGYALNFSTRMGKDAIATAGAAIRKEGSINALEHMVYTACPVCEENGGTPTWSLRAKEAVQNQQTQMMSYKDAVLEIKGVPVVYIPYFTHPDPSSDRRSGLLVPDLGLGSKTGWYYTQPYFWAATDHQDVTFTPTVYERINPLMELEYRKRFFSGSLRANGSFTKEQDFDSDGEKFGDDTWRSHITADGLFDINKTWSWGFAVERQSDDLYDRRYDIDTINSTGGLYERRARSALSQLYAVGQTENFYSEVGALAFQGLREQDDPGETPYVAPLIYAQKNFDLGGFGGLSLTGSSAVIQRDDGISSARGTAELGWRQRSVFGPGLVLEPFAEARGDVYDIEDTTGEFEDETITRGLGLAGAQLSWPLMGGGSHFSFTLEPTFMAAIGTEDPQNERIPNQDTQSFEADESSLFLPSSLSSYDRWEGGTRMAAGLTGAASWGKNQSLDFIVGQRWRENVDENFDILSNLDGLESDYVAAVGLKLGPQLSLQSRVRLDSDDLEVHRVDSQANVSLWRLDAKVRYFSLSETILENQGGESGLIASGRFRFSDAISAVYAVNRNIEEDFNTLQIAGLAFEDECSYFELAYERKETKDRSLGPSEAIRFTFSLKTLGTVGSNTFD